MQMDDNSFFSTILAIVLFFLVVGILGGVLISMKHKEKMAELGYVEVAIPGSVDKYWKKADIPIH